MNGIQLKIDKKPAHWEHPPAAAVLLFLIAGICGSMLFLVALADMDGLGWEIYLTVAVVCSMEWFLYFHHRAFYVPFLLLLLLIGGLAVFVQRSSLWLQLQQLNAAFLGKEELTYHSMRETVLLTAVLFSMLFFILEFIIQSHSFLYVITTSLMLVTPILKEPPGLLAVALLSFYQAAFWTMRFAGNGRSGSLMFKAARNRLSGKCGVVTAVVVLAGFLAAVPLVSRYERELRQLLYEAQEQVSQTLRRISGQADQQLTGGKISSEDNYKTGVCQLELTAVVQPTEPIYLRGFTGGEYIGDEWIANSSEDLAREISRELLEPEWKQRIGSMCEDMYFMMNKHTLREETLEPSVLTIRHYNDVYDYLYEPYCSQRSRGRFDSRNDYQGYTYQYYEQKDINIAWENVRISFEQQRDQYQQMQEAYRNVAERIYTQVPRERLPRLTSLVEENPLETQEEITAFILYTLHSNASYSMTPGWSRIPYGEDIAEYFLFDSGQGYCEHFAVTATLLYRLYGVPARYVTGYMVPPSEFEQQVDGTYYAAATDESAHAWTEIFLKDYGWVPIEVTPAADGSAAAAYPGFNSELLGQLLAERNWNMEVPSLPSERGSVGGSAAAGEEKAGTENIESDGNRLLAGMFLAGMAVLLCVLPVLLYCRRLRILRRRRLAGCRNIFGGFLRMLYFAGYLPGYDGTEEDFAAELSRQLPSVSQEEVLQMQKIVCRAAYSSQQPLPEHEDYVRSLYFRSAACVYKTLKWKQKLRFRYWEVFG